MNKPKKCKECGKGLRGWNKSLLCSHHYQKWYLNSTRGKFVRNLWLLKNKEKMLKCKRDYYYRNKEYLLEKGKEYLKSEKGKKKRKEWLKNNKEKIKEISKKYHLKNRERLLRKMGEYRKKKKLENVTTLK